MSVHNWHDLKIDFSFLKEFYYFRLNVHLSPRQGILDHYCRVVQEQRQQSSWCAHSILIMIIYRGFCQGGCVSRRWFLSPCSYPSSWPSSWHWSSLCWGLRLVIAVTQFLATMIRHWKACYWRLNLDLCLLDVRRLITFPHCYREIALVADLTLHQPKSCTE